VSFGLVIIEYKQKVINFDLIGVTGPGVQEGWGSLASVGKSQLVLDNHFKNQRNWFGL